jgi:hypothetical protein
MTFDDYPRPSPGVHQTPEQIAAEPKPFPAMTTQFPVETSFADWRQRLTSNFARRSTGRWEPLTRVHE